MNISAKSDYAVRALLALAEQASRAQGETSDSAPGSTAPVLTSEALATAQGLPRKFLESIMTELRRAGIVHSVRGAAGGHRLARPAHAISLAEVIRAVDGPLAEVRGLRPHETTYDPPAEHLPVVWVAVRASLRQVLDDVSLEQVRTGDFPSHVRALTESPEAWVNR